MKSLIFLVIASCLLTAGMVGLWFGFPAPLPYAIWFFAGGLVMMSYLGLKTTYNRGGTTGCNGANQPRPLHLTSLDYLKAAVCWFDAFKKTYAIEPGLYYTGKHYDHRAPLLVTSNYFLTVFLVVRRIRAFNARLLVIDTDGINVWCSAGEGKFSNAEILKQLNRYDRKLLTDGHRLTLILPKLGFAGVNLGGLRKAGVRPIIGPIYAKDLPAYLSQPPYKDCDEDRVLFNLQSRLFTWLPGLVQVFTYSFGVLGPCTNLGISRAYRHSSSNRCSGNRLSDSIPMDSGGTLCGQRAMAGGIDISGDLRADGSGGAIISKPADDFIIYFRYSHILWPILFRQFGGEQLFPGT